MTTRIFVANLPYSYTRGHLRELFRRYGTVGDVRIANDRLSGHSKGYGFVEMPNEVQAQSAITNLNDHEIEGRRLRVELSEKPAEERPRRSQFGRHVIDGRR